MADAARIGRGQWAASQLVAAGYTVELDVWDWAAEENFVLHMNDALKRADQVLALWSPSYFERDRFTTPEWTSVPATQGRVVPVKVAACGREPGGLGRGALVAFDEEVGPRLPGIRIMIMRAASS